MSCSIIQDPITKEIISVLAPNGQPSRLYQEILNNIEPDKQKALRLWAQVYTPTFKNENGDWETSQQKMSDMSSFGKLEGDYMESEKGEIGVNKQQLLMLLGPTMYNKPLAQVAVKELLQNSFDAVKTRQNTQKGKPKMIANPMSFDVWKKNQLADLQIPVINVRGAYLKEYLEGLEQSLNYEDNELTEKDIIARVEAEKKQIIDEWEIEVAVDDYEKYVENFRNDPNNREEDVVNVQPGNIDIRVNYDKRTISIQDDGIGMTSDIVKKAFLSIGGTNKEGLDVSERSGGFGLAKVQFLLGSEYVRVVTIRDGVKTSLEASAIQLYNDDFVINKEQTNEPNGTFVEVKIPESYTTPEGTKRDIEFPGNYSSGNNELYKRFDILNQPLIGNLNVNFYYTKENKENKQLLPVGSNMTEEVLPPLFSKIDFSWGSADLYMSIDKKENPKHKILSSGIFQFNHGFIWKNYDKIPYDIVINIKPSVSSTAEQYPFNNQREDFKRTVSNDISSLNAYLTKYALGEAEKDAKSVFSNITGLPISDPTKVLTPEEREKIYADVNKTIEENKKRRIDQGLETAEEEVRKIYKLVIDEKGVKNKETGKIEATNEKEYDSTFKTDKEIEKVEAIDTINFNPKLPQYHNNTNFDYLKIPGAAEFFSDFGSVVLDMVRFAGKELGYEYKILKSENEKFFAGVSIDKSYGGVHVRKIINAIFVNPLAFDVESLEEAVGVSTHTLIHEINHTTVSGEGASFTTALAILYGKIYATGKYGLYEGLFRSVYKKHFETFKQLKYEYEKSTTRNLSESFNGDKIEGDTAGDVQRNAADVSAGQAAEGGYRGDQEDNRRDQAGDVVISNLNAQKKRFVSSSNKTQTEILSDQGLKLDENGEPDIQYVRDSRVEEHIKEKNDPNYNQNKIDQYVANSVVGAVADRLAENLGVNYNIVTPQQAREITSASQIPWNGEKAFYYNGEVYFIDEGFSINNVIHEFSHPLVSALFIDNKPLFDKLYQDILKTTEGQSIESDVERLYSEFSKNSIQFKSEVLVRAITKAAVQSSPPAGLRDFAQKVIFAFKQLFRKLFGQKIKIEKLSLNTTISDLAKMLKGDVFTLDVEAIRNNLAVDYARDITNFTNELEQIDYSAVSISVRRFYDLVSNHIRRIRENKNYSEVREFLVEESGRGQLQELKSTLQATEIDERLKDILTDLEIQKRTAQNFVHSLLRVNKMLDKISTHIKTLSETEPDEKNVILNIFYYDLLLRNWDKLITEISDNLQESGLRPNTDMGNLLSNMKSMIDFNNRQISKIYSNKTYSVLYEHIEPTAKAVDEYFEKTLQEAREKNFSEAKIKDIEQRYEKMKITKEKVREMLLGRMGDTNMFSAFFESYTENPDPIVGGFTMFIKNAYNEVSAETQTKLYDFINEIKPYLEDAGYKKGNFSAVTKQMVFEDNVPFINDKGNFDTKKVWTLINPFKDRGVELARLNYRLDKAISENNEQEIDNIQSEIRKHKVDYFHQEYVDEYYQKERIYEEPFGQEAFRRKRLILESIRQLDVLNYDDDALTEIAEQKKLLWRQYAQLASLTDEFGEPKVGDELEIAKVERKYRVESRKFFEWKPVKGMFESALRRFEQLLVDAGYPEGSEEFINRKELWIKNNTVTSYTQEFFEKRNETLRKIKDLMAQIPEPTRSEIDTSVDMEALLDISVGFRDQHGQIIGTDMSERTREKVYNRQEEIIKKREKLAGYSGLTVDQMDRLSELFEKIKFKGQLSTIEQEEFDDLLQIKGSLGVSKETKIELQKAFAELSELQSREATDYYVDIVNNHLSRMGEDPIDNDTASNLLDISYINKYFVKSPEFKAWFLKNHIEKYVWDSKEKERVKKYERLFIWNRTRPNDPNHYVVTTLSNGEVINGKPTLSYEYRRVKDEYRTERIVGKTVDNLGNWLPKTLAEGAKDARYINPEYEKLRRNSPAIFRLLEKTSSAFIELQADSPRQSKLYLQIPRYRKMSSELLRKSKDTLTKWYKAVRQIFVSANDDVEDGLNFNAEKLIYADMFDEEISKVPITGLYNLDSEEVSLNIYDSIFRYVYSATKQKKLIELNPFAQSLLKVVDDPKNGIKDMSKINKFIFQKSGIKRFIGIKGVSQRADALHNIYEREFEGIRKKGYLSDFRPLHKLISLGAKVGAFGTFAMNISPSAIKNRAAGLIQLYIDAAGGRYINMKSYTLGLPRAYKMLTSLSSNLYNIDNKNVDFQLLQAFDPTQGLFEMTLGTGSGSDKGGMFGRSITSDGATLSFFMSPRKFMELNVAINLLSGMLHHIWVEKDSNGVKTNIRYIDALILKDGKLSLVEGVDPDYAPGKKKFNELKNKIHSLNNRLQGTYAEFDQPESQRYIFMNMFYFYKKFFTSMLMNRWAEQRPSYSMGNVATGYHRSMLSSLRDMVKYKSFSQMTFEEKINAWKFMTDLAFQMVMFSFVSMFLGYDPNDEERFQKMKKRSGVKGLDKEPFNITGYLTNHTLTSSLETLNELETFGVLSPISLGQGFDVNFIWGRNFKTITRTAEQQLQLDLLLSLSYKKLFEVMTDVEGLMRNDKSAYYSIDVGRFPWMKKGQPKLYRDLYSIFGVTGSQIDPVTALKNYEYKIKRD